MPKKLYAWRYSEDVANFILDYQKKHKLKNVDDALKLIIQRLQYLEDLALEQTQKPSGLDAEYGLYANPMQWIESHPCEDRAIVKQKDGFIIYCQGKKIPLEVCITQQKKAMNKQWKRCYPPHSKPPKKWQKRADFEKQYGKPYRDDEGYFNPNDDYFRDDWGDTI